MPHQKESRYKRLLSSLAKGMVFSILMSFGLSMEAQAAAGRVRIVNGNVVTDQGVELRGAPFFMSIFNTQHMRNNETTYRDYFNDVKNNYGMNCVRICPWIGNWEYNIATDTNHYNQIIYMLDKVVQWAEDAGIYAVINCHTKFNTKVNVAKSQEFWNIVAPRYKDKTHVVYEITNEPDLITVRTNMDDMYAYVRERAPDTHLICWSVADPGVISQADPDAPSDSSRATIFSLQDIQNASSISYTNASVGFHVYPWNANGDTRRWDKAKGFRDAGYPVICTEFMCFQNADTIPIHYDYVTSNIRDARAYGMSWIQWCPRFNYASIDQYTEANSLYNSDIGERHQLLEYRRS
jgi:hypothetical protein